MDMTVNLPRELYSTQQIKIVEQFVIQKGILSGFTLMERAGNAVFEYVQYSYSSAKNMSIFCGSGNNAGDGYIVATRALQAGLNVCVYSVSEITELQGDALLAYQQYINAGGNVIPFQIDVIFDSDIIIDALLGTGLNRQVTQKYEQAINAINESRCPVIAVDIPSGLHADTGNVMGVAVEANATITFIGLKQGLFTGFAVQYTGKIILASLALPDIAWQHVSSSITRVLPNALPPRQKYAHKGHFGHVLVIGGDVGYSGAARLAGMAALRMGAGLVSIATHPDNAAVMNIACPELMCHGVANSTQLHDLLEKASVIVLGTGLGQRDWGKVLFTTAINCNKPIIVDADGLNFLAQFPKHNPQWILTPHVGEASRLLGSTIKTIQKNRFEAAQTLQQKYGGVVLLKGAGTLIATDNQIAISNTGNPGMASGGMGDVLAGVIASLVAQGMSLEDAAKQGAYAHGIAADNAVKQDGERGLLASDLLSYLRHWINAH
jgi:NAD(P)H-hydrate epimerase